MGSVNRYSNIQPARYTPRTLQELMVAPSYMREQHNQLDESRGELETALAQVDPLAIHSDLARRKQQELYDQLNKQAEQLSSKGFNPASKSDFIRLNKQYQQEVGPTGTLGKIQAAKKALELKRDSYIANSTKLGYSPEAAAANWEDHQGQYNSNFNESGNVTNIDDLYAPNYYSYIDEGIKLFKDAGITSSDISNAGGKIKTDNDGTYVVNYESRDVNSSNKEQLADAVEFLNKRMLNPNSDAYKSIVHQRKDPREAVQELFGLSDVYIKDSVGKSRQSGISNFSPSVKAEVEDNSIGITVANTQHAAQKYADRSYGDITETISSLENKPNLTQDEVQELNELNNFKESVDTELKSNKNYQSINNALNSTTLSIQQQKQGTFDYSADPTVRAAIENNESKEVIAALKNKVAKNTINLFNQYTKELDEFIKPHVKAHILKSTNYMLTPYTPKQASYLNQASLNIEKLFKSSPEAIQNIVKMEGVTLNGKNHTTLTPNDKDNIAKLINNTDNGAVELLTVTPIGTSGKPEYTLRIKTNENNSYNLDGWSNGDIGNGEYVTVKLSFNDVNNGIVKNVNGLVEQYVRSSGKIGNQLADGMEITRIKNSYTGKTFGDLNKKDYDNSPVLTALFDEAMDREGLNPNTTQEEYNKILKVVNNNKIK